MDGTAASSSSTAASSSATASSSTSSAPSTTSSTTVFPSSVLSGNSFVGESRVLNVFQLMILILSNSAVPNLFLFVYPQREKKILRTP